MPVRLSCSVALALALAVPACGGRSDLSGVGRDASTAGQGLDAGALSDGGPGDGARDAARDLPLRDRAVPADLPERCESLPAAPLGYTPPVRLEMADPIVDLDLLSDGVRTLVAVSQYDREQSWVALLSLSPDGGQPIPLGRFPGATSARLGPGPGGTVALFTAEPDQAVLRELDDRGQVLRSGRAPLASGPRPAGGVSPLARPAAQPLAAAKGDGQPPGPSGWWVAYNDGTTLSAGSFVPDQERPERLLFVPRRAFTVDAGGVAVAVGASGGAYLLVPGDDAGPRLHRFDPGGDGQPGQNGDGEPARDLPWFAPAFPAMALTGRSGEGDVLTFFGWVRSYRRNEYLGELFVGSIDGEGTIGEDHRDLAGDETPLAFDLAFRSDGEPDDPATFPVDHLVRVATAIVQQEGARLLLQFDSRGGGGVGAFQTVPELEGAQLAKIALGPCGALIAATLGNDPNSLYTTLFPDRR